LLAAGELERVTADVAIARRLLEDAGRHLATAAAAARTADLSGAYQLAYDAFRKSAASLLAVQGLRATSRGGHVAVQEAVIAQFGSTVRVFRAFGRSAAPAIASSTQHHRAWPLARRCHRRHHRCRSGTRCRRNYPRSGHPHTLVGRGQLRMVSRLRSPPEPASNVISATRSAGRSIPRWDAG
jgi:hypothetical protein